MNQSKVRFLDFLRIPRKAAPVLFFIFVLNKLVSSLIPMMQVIVTAKFVDTALLIFDGSRNYTDIYAPIGIMIAMIAYQYLNNIAISLLTVRYKMKLDLYYSTPIIRRRAELEYRYIEDNNTWELMNRVCQDPTGKIFGGFQDILGAASLAIRVASILFLIMQHVWWVGVVIVIIAVPLFRLAIHSGKETYQASKEMYQFQRRADYLGDLLTSRENVEERSLFGCSEDLNARWYLQYEKARKVSMRVSARRFVRMKSASIVTLLLSLLIVGGLIVPLNSGGIGIGMFIALSAATFDLVQVMAVQLTDIMNKLASKNEYLKDVNAFNDLARVPDSVVLPAETPIRVETIDFVDVTFRYPGTEKEILRHFSLHLQAGLHYAVVGANGAGKTTLTKLLTGLYDQYEGTILVNGTDLKEYTQAELKSMFSVVYQDFARYSIPFSDNILLGNIRQPDQEAMENVVEKIGLKGVVERLPNGSETWLGKIKTDGVDLSGGEWQRVAVARSLVSNTSFCIMDEPTAALDPVSESKVYELIGKVSDGNLMLFITHRLGAAKLMDRIIVIEDGGVAEQGTHNELMNNKGLYYTMFESQRSWYQ